MTQAYGSGWMADTAGRYRTVVSVFNQATTTWQRCLKADPRRWYVRFDIMSTPGTLCYVQAGGVQTLQVPTGGTNLPYESKFRDAPSVTPGEWYAFVGGGFPIMITEVLFVSDAEPSPAE